jgi:hypothetical protein
MRIVRIDDLDPNPELTQHRHVSGVLYASFVDVDARVLRFTKARVEPGGDGTDERDRRPGENHRAAQCGTGSRQ